MEPICIDGFMASLQAAESIGGCRAVLHGPGACRSQNASLAHRLSTEFLPPVEGPFYNGSARIPCTYLDGNDYVHGANYKMTDLLDTLDGVELAVVIPSPGTSLIGDDLEMAVMRSMFRGKVLCMKGCHMSEPACTGYDSTLAFIVRNVCERREKIPGRVNVIGLPRLMEGWDATEEELEEYLDVMGIEVNAFIGADCTFQELLSAGSAEMNLAVMPEYCRETSRALESLGVPTLWLPVPFGFSSTESWIRSVADAFGADPGKALSICRKTSEHCRLQMKKAGQGTSVTRGMTYSVSLDSELALPLCEWMYRYLGMFPVSVRRCRWWSEDLTDRMSEFLSGIGCPDSLDCSLSDERCDVLFADGHTAMVRERNGSCMTGVDLQLPTGRMYPFVPRPVLGATGARRILDDVMNGLFSPHYRCRWRGPRRDRE